MERKINALEKFFLAHKQIIYGLLLLLSVFMHFYRLASVPHGLHVDEAGMAYDAYCIANYSVDRYLNYMPVYLINFGHGQSALNAYLVALLIKICGGDWNYWIIRIPGAVMGVLLYITGVQIVRKYMGDKWGGIGFSANCFSIFYNAVQVWIGL